MTEIANQPRRRCFGLFNRRERWGLSGRGWLMLFVVLGLLAVGIVRGVHPFLAPTQRVDAKYLVVEGWVHDYVIPIAVQEFYAGHYEKVFTTGGPVTGSDGATNIFNTVASVGAERLLAAGIPTNCVQMVPAHVVGRDRTYTSAVALRDWLKENNLVATNLNVLTEDCHARRTRKLFQAAFGKAAVVGVISVPNPDYDPQSWWRYSEGVREVLGESIAWIYAEFLFTPEKPRVLAP